MQLSLIEDRVKDLIHPSVQDEGARRTHAQFMMSRLVMGVLTLASLPMYMAFVGRPGLVISVAFVWLLMPLIAVAVLSKTGKTEYAAGLSAVALTALTVTLACGYGGLGSPMLIWLAVVPLEALIAGTSRAIQFAFACALLGLVVLTGLDGFGYVHKMPFGSLADISPLLILSVIAHIAAVGGAMSRQVSGLQQQLISKLVLDEAVLESIGDLVTGHDSKGQVVFASRSSQVLLGVSHTHLHGRGLLERVLVSDRPMYLKALSDARNCQKPITVTLRMQVVRAPVASTSPDGQLQVEHGGSIFMEMKAQTLEKTHLGCEVVATFRDITEHKAHELELETARHDAEKANELKGKFLATVSHELRTPLNAIIGFSEILGNPALGPLDEFKSRDYAHIIHTSGHHLLEVVNTLLDISKIESGNFDLTPESFSLTHIIRDCCDLIQIKADSGHVRLVRELPEMGVSIIADKRACKQILINLLSNAVKFTREGGQVTVSLVAERDNLVLCIKDTGIGIASSDLPQLGNPFFQARSSYDRPYEGTGLGLSVVKGLIGLHKGTFDITSSPGAGTTVTVVLPADCQRPVPSRVTSLPIHRHKKKTGASTSRHATQPSPATHRITG